MPNIKPSSPFDFACTAGQWSAPQYFAPYHRWHLTKCSGNIDLRFGAGIPDQLNRVCGQQDSVHQGFKTLQVRSSLTETVSLSLGDEKEEDSRAQVIGGGAGGALNVAPQQGAVSGFSIPASGNTVIPITIPGRLWFFLSNANQVKATVPGAAGGTVPLQQGWNPNFPGSEGNYLADGISQGPGYYYIDTANLASVQLSDLSGAGNGGIYVESGAVGLPAASRWVELAANLLGLAGHIAAPSITSSIIFRGDVAKLDILGNVTMTGTDTLRLRILPVDTSGTPYLGGPGAIVIPSSGNPNFHASCDFENDVITWDCDGSGNGQQVAPMPAMPFVIVLDSVAAGGGPGGNITINALRASVGLR